MWRKRLEIELIVFGEEFDCSVVKRARVGCSSWYNILGVIGNIVWLRVIIWGGRGHL